VAAPKMQCQTTVTGRRYAAEQRAWNPPATGLPVLTPRLQRSGRFLKDSCYLTTDLHLAVQHCVARTWSAGSPASLARFTRRGSAVRSRHRPSSSSVQRVSTSRRAPVALERSQRDEQHDPVPAAGDVDDGAAVARWHGCSIEARRDDGVAQRGPERCDRVPAGCEAHGCDATAFPGGDALPLAATVEQHGRRDRHQARACVAGVHDHPHRHADLGGPGRGRGGPRAAAGQGGEQRCENARRGDGCACRAAHGHAR
jgi:hypothetical protein